VPLISVTRLRVHSPRYRLVFLWYALRSALQDRRAPGCLDVDDSRLRAFMMHGVHRRAMPKLRLWCDEASVAHWQQDSAALPSWEEAYRQMIQVGRPSKVDHPSPRHLTLSIPRPR